MTGAGQSVTATVDIPYGPTAGDPRVSLQGAERGVVDAIGTAFGFDRNSVSGMSIHDAVLEASRIARSAMLVTTELGGRVVPQAGEQGEPSRPAATETPNGGADWLLGQIAACNTVEELRRLWAENQAAFANPVVMDAWKARGRALKGS